MDIAMILDELVPGAQYGGMPGSTEAEYDALRWEDARSKPTWAEIEAAWPAVEQAMLDQQSKPDVLALLNDRITVLESDMLTLKVSRA